MHVLVTGGAGFIGSHLSERLLRGGSRVRVLDNFSTGKRENLPSSSDIELLAGDIRQPANVIGGARGVDAIVHLAAIASVQACVDDPVGTHETNLVGTINVLEAARECGVRRVIFASSAAVYGDAATIPVREDALPRPLTPYAIDKLAGEQYLAFYAKKYGIATTAFRFFNVYGPRQDPSSPYSGVISIFVERMAQGRPITIFGDGRQTRDFVYVEDLAEILVRALTQPKAEGRVLNVGRGTECSLLELLATLEELFGAPAKREHQPGRLGDIRRSCADVQTLSTVFTSAPTTALRDGLARLLQYARR